MCGTLLLIRVYFLCFVLPTLGLTLLSLVAEIGALGLHYAAYIPEVCRAGLRNVGRDQWDAETALGLRWKDAPFRMILSQAFPPIVPALGNCTISIFKETPVLTTVSVLEMLQQAKLIGTETFRYTELLTIVGLIFLSLSLLSAALLRSVEHWFVHPLMQAGRVL